MKLRKSPVRADLSVFLEGWSSVMDLIISSFRNIFRKRLRSLLTISGIAIGVLSVMVISTIGDVGKMTINAEIDSIGMGGLTVKSLKSGDTDVFTNQLNLIENSNDVFDAMPLMMQYTQTILRNKKSECVVWGVDNGVQNIVSMDLKHGRYINENDVNANAKVCIVDETYAEKIYKRTNIVGKTVEVLFNGVMEDFEIIGVVSSGGNMLQGLMGSFIPCFIYTPYTTLEAYSGTSTFDQIAIKLNDGVDTDSAVSRLTSRLNNMMGEGAVKIENMDSQMDKLNGILDIVTFVLSVIAGISLVVAGLSIMTMMLVSVNERTREIGIKKSIGASRVIIMKEFLVESLIISLLGSLSGAIIGLALSYLGCLILSVEFVFNFSMFLFCILFAVALGILFGVYPALQAAKLRPVDALRCE